MSAAEHALPAAGSAPASLADSAAAARSRRLLLLSVLLAAGGIGLLALYLHRCETEVSGGERVQLLAVIKPVPRGTVLTQEMLGVREVPVSYVESRAVKAAELGKVKGIRTAIDLDPQDSLLWTDLAIAVENRDLSSLVQPGNRAYTIETPRNGSGNDLIRPGDYVDVLATFSTTGATTSTATRATKVLLQRVLVLAVGSETERQAFQGQTNEKGAATRRSSNLTLSLKLDEAQMIAAASEQGELSVVLRGASDPTVLEGLPDVTPSNLVEAAAQANRRRNTQNASGSMPVRINGSDGR